MSSNTEENIQDIVDLLETERPKGSKESEKQDLSAEAGLLGEEEKINLLAQAEDVVIGAQRFISTYKAVDTVTSQEDVEGRLPTTVIDDLDFIEEEKEVFEQRYVTGNGFNEPTLMLDILEFDGIDSHPEGPINSLAHMGENPKGGLLHEYSDRLSEINSLTAEILPTLGADTDIDTDRIYNEINNISRQLGFSDESSTVYAELSSINASIQNIDSSSDVDLDPLRNDIEQMSDDISDALQDIDSEISRYGNQIQDIQRTLNTVKNTVESYDPAAADLTDVRQDIADSRNYLDGRLSDIESRVNETYEQSRQARENTGDLLQGQRTIKSRLNNGDDDDDGWSRRAFAAAAAAAGMSTLAACFGGASYLESRTNTEQNEDIKQNLDEHRNATEPTESRPDDDYTRAEPDVLVSKRYGFDEFERCMPNSYWNDLEDAVEDLGGDPEAVETGEYEFSDYAGRSESGNRLWDLDAYLEIDDETRSITKYNVDPECEVGR